MARALSTLEISRISQFPTNTFSPSRETSPFPVCVTFRGGSTTPPATFDARILWRDLLLGPPKQVCGSCWAYAAIGMFNNRYNIAIHEKLFFAIDYLFLCNNLSVLRSEKAQSVYHHSVREILRAENQFQCHGDFLLSGLYFLYFDGVPLYDCGTKSDYASFIYTPFYPSATIRSCDNYYGSSRKLCAYSTIVNGAIRGRPIRIHTSFLPYNFSGIRAIQEDILSHGPVATTIDAYSDLWTYDTTTIYHKQQGAVFVSGHAILLIGWGKDYWIFQNSWGTDWGDGGYGRIAMGVDMCGVETNCLGVLPSHESSTSPMLHQWSNLLTSFDYDIPKIRSITALWDSYIKTSGIKKSPVYDSSGFSFSLCYYADCQTGVDPIQKDGYTLLSKPMFPGIDLTTFVTDFSDPYIQRLWISVSVCGVVLVSLLTVLLLRRRRRRRR